MQKWPSFQNDFEIIQNNLIMFIYYIIMFYLITY